MKKLLVGISFILLFLSGCSTLQVQVDSDPDYMYGSLSNFYVVYEKKDDGKDFMRSRFKNQLIKYFEKKGYVLSDSGKADFYMIIHFNVKMRREMKIDYERIGVDPRLNYYNRIPIGGGEYIDPFPPVDRSAIITKQIYEYEEGKLVVDVVDIKENAVFWQSVAQDEVSKASSQEEMTKYIDKVVDKMFNKFPSKFGVNNLEK